MRRGWFMIYSRRQTADGASGGRRRHQHPTNLRCLLDINSIGPVQGSRHRFHGWPNLLILPLWPRHAGSNRWAINQNYFHISPQLVRRRPRGTTVRWPGPCCSVTAPSSNLWWTPSRGVGRRSSWVVTPFRRRRPRVKMPCKTLKYQSVMFIFHVNAF